VKHLESRAIEISPEAVFALGRVFVSRHFSTHSFDAFGEQVVGFLDFGEGCRIEQIQAMPQIYDGSQNEGLIDLRGRATFASHSVLSVLEGSLWVIFSEVDAMAEPIVDILALAELGGSLKNLTGNGFVTAVKSQD